MRKEIKILSRQKHIILDFNSFQTNKAFFNFHKSIRGFKKGFNTQHRFNSGPATSEWPDGPCPPPPPPPTFLCSKKKKGRQRGKRKGFKAETIKSLIILERLEYENFSCLKTMVADNTFQCSIPPRSHPPQFNTNFASHVTDKTNLKKI